jgi:hypothetical protein
MKIGIEINGVLRDTIGKFKMCYEKFLMPNEYNLSEDSEFEYKILEPIDTPVLKNHFSFKDDEELIEFMYEDCPMEIFGHSMSTEMMTFNYLNDFYNEFKYDNEIYIISDEVGKSKPATLFFLSKFSCLIENYIFYNEKNKKEVLSQFDTLITSNPSIIIDYKNDLNIIKFNTEYNTKINHSLEINSLSELSKVIKETNNVKTIQ